MKILFLVQTLFFLFIFSACNSTPILNDPSTSEINSPRTLILISIDGYRYDYTDKFNAPNMTKFRAQSAWTEGLIPIFPSLTFPNHYSIVTGLSAEEHNIVGNHFLDKKNNKTYFFRNSKDVTNGRWYGGTPLWNKTLQAKGSSYSYFWVGSEAEIQGLRPTESFQFDNSVSYRTRMDKVLEWIKKPYKEGPKLILTYFQDVDKWGHKAGPDSSKTAQAVKKMDDEIGYLMDNVNKLRASKKYGDIYVSIVSDHGMEKISKNKTINLYSLFQKYKDRVKTTEEIAVSYVYSDDTDAIQEIYRELKEKKHLDIYYKRNIPERLKLKNSAMAPDLLLVPKSPYSLLITSPDWSKGHIAGAHGFDNQEKNMQGIFYLNGPRVKPGKRKEMLNTELYSIYLDILGINKS